jgi:hypothetical protein
MINDWPSLAAPLKPTLRNALKDRKTTVCFQHYRTYLTQGTFPLLSQCLHDLIFRHAITL